MSFAHIIHLLMGVVYGHKGSFATDFVPAGRVCATDDDGFRPHTTYYIYIYNVLRLLPEATDPLLQNHPYIDFTMIRGKTYGEKEGSIRKGRRGLRSAGCEKHTMELMMWGRGENWEDLNDVYDVPMSSS